MNATQKKLAGKRMGHFGNRGEWHIMDGDKTVCKLAKYKINTEPQTFKDGAELTDMEAGKVCWRCVAGKTVGTSDEPRHEKSSGIPAATFLRTKKSLDSYNNKPLTQTQSDYIVLNSDMSIAQAELLKRREAYEIIRKIKADKATNQ